MQRTVLCLIAVLGLALAARGHDLGSEETGPYYVNIGIAGNGLATAMCDSYEVEIRPLIPNEAAQVQWISSLDFWTADADVTYRFRQVGEEYHLYKFTTGRRPVRIQLFGMMLDPAKKARYLQEMRAASPEIFASANLSVTLALLGVLGATAEGQNLTFDFVDGLESPDAPKVDGFPSVVIGNVKPMLLRYAYAIQLDGLPSRPLTPDDRTPTTNDPNGRYKYWNAVMARKPDSPEQFILDTCFDGTDDIYLGKEEAAELRAIPNSIAAVDLTPALPVKCVYVPQRGTKSSRYGSARACFVPIKCKQGNSEFYPIYVFSSAFFSHQMLTSAILREYYHAQWWHAISALDRTDANQERLRRYLLRLPYPWLALDIYYAINNQTEIDPSDTDYSAMIYLLGRAYLYIVSQTVSNAGNVAAAQPLPWTASVSLITPSLGTVDDEPACVYDYQDAVYATGVWAMAKRLDDKKGRMLPLATIVAANAPNPLPNPPLDTVQGALMDAIGMGYTRSSAFRNARFGAAVDKLKTDWTPLRPSGVALAAAPNELLDAAVGAGENLAFAVDDLAYLHAFCPYVATEATFVTRLAALYGGTVHGANALVPEDYATAVVNVNFKRDQALQALLTRFRDQLVVFDQIKTDQQTNDQQLQTLQQQIRDAQTRAGELQQNADNAQTDLDNLEQALETATTALATARTTYENDKSEDNQTALQTATTNQRTAQQNYDQRAELLRTQIRGWQEDVRDITSGEVVPLREEAQTAQLRAQSFARDLLQSETAMRAGVTADTWQSHLRFLVREFFQKDVDSTLDFWAAVNSLKPALADPPPDLQTFP